MKNRSLVTVYVPTRNRSGLLRRAVESVLSQTYEAIEVIVADDNSVDDTAEVVGRLVERNHSSKTIKYLRMDRQGGACAARNSAIECAAGEFITGLDDDDYFVPDRIARLMSAFDPSVCSFVFDGYVREKVTPTGAVRRTVVPLTRTAELSTLLKRNIVGNQVLTLTERLRGIGGFDERLPAWQDYDTWIRLARSFGAGRPVGGSSYVHTVDESRQRISGDKEKIKRAYEIFLGRHSEYADRDMHLCLRLAEACYGIDALTSADIPRLLRLGEPRYVLFAVYSYLSNRWPRRIVR